MHRAVNDDVLLACFLVHVHVHVQHISGDARARMARVKNSIAALRLASLSITPEAIMRVYEASFERGWEAKDLLDPERMAALTRFDGGDEEDDGRRSDDES